MTGPVFAGTGFGARALNHFSNLAANGLLGFADGYLTDGTLSAATQGALFGALPTAAAGAFPGVARIDFGANPFDIAGALGEEAVNQHLAARNRAYHGDTYGWQGITPYTRPADGFYYPPTGPELES
ncbi:MAG: hypothetical protein KIT43_10435 [Bauldia sp.]|nr:hypothetical protein [Bauldia sp.]